jgi:exopolysaccharide production protein ExoZ
MRTFTGIQAMRGIAALSVVGAHLLTTRWGMGISEFAANTVAGFPRCGVDVFFVISGFIIALTADQTGQAEGRGGVLGFAVKRAIRIFPLYWIVLFAAVVSGAWFVPGLKGLPHTLIFNAAFFREVFLITNETAFVPPAWSMCFEVSFYATVAVVLVLAPKRAMEMLLVLIAALAVIDLSPIPMDI